MDEIITRERNGELDTVSDFKDRMTELTQRLSPEAREIVKMVLVDEHNKQFIENRELSEGFAIKALSLAKKSEESEA